jgi:hypothetical protein
VADQVFIPFNPAIPYHNDQVDVGMIPRPKVADAE